MTGRLRIGVAAAVALALTTTGMMRLLAPSTWLWPVLGAIVVSAGSGELARRLVRPRPLVIAIQCVFVFWYDTVVLAHDKAVFGLIPDTSSTVKLGSLFHQGSVDIQGTVPGGPATPGIAAILVISLGALAILIDALAATYAVAPLAGLPLLALYLVPATRTGGGYDWLAFALTAVGYTALLSAEGRERLGRWGRPLVHAGTRRAESGAPARPTRVDTGPIAATGHQITTIAVIAAVIAPVLIPTVSNGLFGLGPSNGNGGSGGNGNLTLSEKVDLKASLNNPPVTALTYKSSDGAGKYLRLQGLDIFDPRQGFIAENGRAQSIDPSGQIAPKVPDLELGTQPTTSTTQITWTGNISNKVSGPAGAVTPSLPVPYPELSVGASLSPNDWSFDPHTLGITGDRPVQAGFTYTVTSFDPELNHYLTRSEEDSSAKLSTADATARGLANDLYVPADFPAGITNLAQSIVGPDTQPFEQAVDLQYYFNDAKRFRYDTRVPDNTPTNAMLNLLSSKVGFCQTFASTMTMMARSLGIPARVAVGFTEGAVDGKGTYTVTSHDLHAWPELYFDKLGWVRFEPTVGIQSGGGHGSIPGYASPKPSTSPTTAPTTAATGAGASGTASSSACTTQQRKAGDCPGDNGNSTIQSKQPFGYLGWFGAVPRFFDYWLLGGSVGAVIIRFVLLAALVVASIPMLIRILRRRRRGRIAAGRHGRGAPEEDADGLKWGEDENAPTGVPERDGERQRVLAAWAEIRDSATDLGYSWPPSETPRQSAERIIKQARFSTPAQDAMDRITGLAERANYARTVRKSPSSASSSSNLFDDVRTIRSSLAEPVSRRTRVRATVLPPSAMAALRERREDLTERVYERVQHTGARIRRSARRKTSDGQGKR
jgi:transglutaminase-like putative cysteine protease